MNNIERNHILKVVFQFIREIAKELIFIIIGYSFLNSKFGSKIAIILIIAGIIIDISICFLEWYKTFFYIKDGSIFYQSGILNIKKREIPFNNINTVDVSQSIIEKVFNLCKIKVDTGSVKSDESEILLLINSERAFELKDTLLVRQRNEKESEQENKQQHKKYILSMKDLMIYALTSNSIFKGVGIIYALYHFSDDYISKIFKVDIGKSTENMVKSKIYGNVILGIVGLIIILIILSIILSIISSFIKYYNFNVCIDEDKLNINHGLFNKKNYSFDIKKIKGIHIKQSLLMQFFNIRTLEIESIGYGDEKGEKAILYPVCNEEFQNNLIKELLPEFLYDGSVNKVPKNAYLRFIFKKIVFSLIAAAYCIYRFKYGYLSFILMIFLIALGHMQFKNTSAGISDRLVYMSYNGFNKKQSIIKIKAVQSLSISYNYFQKLKGVCNYNINIFSNSFGNSIEVKNLSNDLMDDFTCRIS
ncbi:PH domain-containing protein [Haloimpatiens sp. FM7330]|uniref:PH domain-containing protein n=1 Tax=Haloimpatiens sp. FM7330 TaxID=3298610 RepID=UPI003643A307